MRTGGVVAGAWPGEVVVPDQLATSESRAALLTSLTASTSSAAQAKALVHLLNLWPPFDQQVRCWESGKTVGIDCLIRMTER
ncbi:hypothetical protein E2C01_074173 [Portunus trituberculatus]|uniref:Uncharacterized protein n=1 Tax=Portunus trituberculatus TaxID=210409 RepID=A0A5B7ICJ7_PORTR|nr:hypothetical protein [Portunus trituberculatus]